MDSLAYPHRTISVHDGPARGAVWVWLVLVAITLAVVGWQVWPRAGSGHPADVSGRAATSAEATAVTDVVQNIIAAQGHARLTGDVSRLAEVFVDDPAYPPFADWATAWKQQRGDFEQLLAAVDWQMPDHLGLLTFVAADALRIHRDGPPYLAGPGKPIRVYDIMIDGDHAGAKSVLREGGGTIEHYILTRVNGAWRVGAIWTTCSPGGCA